MRKQQEKGQVCSDFYDANTARVLTELPLPPGSNHLALGQGSRIQAGGQIPSRVQALLKCPSPGAPGKILSGDREVTLDELHIGGLS